MAFNWRTFQTRTLTAVIFAAVMLTGLLWNYWSFFILFSIIHFGCWWEYLKLIEKIHQTKIDNVVKWLFIFSGFVLMIILSLKSTSNTWIEKEGVLINLKWVLWMCTVLLLMVFLFQNKIVPLKAKLMCLAGFIYLSLSLGLMLRLSYFYELSYSSNNEPEIKKIFSPLIPCLIVFSIWINDTMAYIVGSLIGKTSLSSISPKKTWEGTVGGIMLCVLIIGFIIAPIIFPKLVSEFHVIRNYNWYLIAAIASIAGTFGDLLESKLKRMAGVKDSGTFMPGHGGFLDRFDSLLLAIPAVWLYVFLFMK
jgi:phosphatidate cytidylyltransferase